MKVFIIPSLAIATCAFHQAPTNWQTPGSSSSLAPRFERTALFMSLSKNEEVDSNGGPFTRKKLLETTTKAAGVLGAGLFVETGFIAGVPYNGKPDLSGKTAVITGANTGLGKETALRLAQFGADVTIACRNPDKGHAALEDIQAQAPGAKVEVMSLDLASLASIDSFAKRYSSSVDQLDILVNNAGVMAIPERQTTADGFERQFGVNHLGHFRLTNLLLPKVLKSTDGRIVNVSSSAHLFATTVEWDDLNAEASGAYGPWSAYGLSKLSNILFTKALQKRIDEKGGPVTCSALHPGACRTELGRFLFDPSQPVNPLITPLLVALTLVTRSAKQGAQTQIACAAEPTLGKGSTAGGVYFVGPKISEKPSELALDPEVAEKMWAASERMVGKFTV